MSTGNSGTHMIVRVLLIAGVAVSAGTPHAQTTAYPNKPVRIMTFGAGGTLDFTARMMAQNLAEPLGQPVIVDNRNGSLPIEIAAKAMPDGYTLLVSSGVLWLTPYLRDRVSWDPIGDFAPITLLVMSPNAIALHPSVAATSVKELIALARAKPGVLNYATSGTGTVNHISGELFKSMVSIDIVRINYSSTGTAVTGLLAGQVQLMFANLAAMAPHVKSGKMKALAVTSAEPSILFPGLPTIAASGLPGYEAVSRLGAFAPARTSATIVTRLNQEMVKVLNKTDVKEKFFNSGIETVGSSAAQLTEKVKSEMARLGKVIKDANIRDE